jgi:hypothetical protein
MESGGGNAGWDIWRFGGVGGTVRGCVGMGRI